MKKISLPLTLIGVAISSGCTANTADEKMEQYSRGLYDKYVSESKFCDAIFVTKKRFDYVSDNKTSDSKIQYRMKEWDNLAKKIDIDCQKERWPEKERNYKELISKAKFQVTLSEKITVEMKISPPKKDSWDRNCIRELKIINNSDYFIHAFEGSIFLKKHAIKDFPIKWEMKRARRPMAMQPEEATKEIPPIAPKETRELNVCQFFLTGANNSLENEKIVDANKLDGINNYENNSTNLPLTSIEEMQGRYMKLQLKNIRIGNDKNIISVDISRNHINDLKNIVFETEDILKKENPFTR